MPTSTVHPLLFHLHWIVQQNPWVFNEELIHLVDENQPFDCQSGGDPNRSEISIIAPSMRDKSLAPENQGTLTLYMPAFMDYRNEWETRLDASGKRVRGEAYQN